MLRQKWVHRRRRHASLFALPKPPLRYSLTARGDKQIGRRRARVQRRELGRLPIRDLDLAAADPGPALGDEPYRKRVKAMLGRKNARREPLLVVAGMHRHDRLGDDRTGVNFGTHEMHGAAGKAHARRQCLALGMEAGEGRQQRRMDVDHAVAPRLDKAAVKQPHEARKTDEVDPRCPQVGVRGGGKLAAAAMRDDDRRNACGRGPRQPGRSGPVADDKRCFGRVGGIGAGRDQRL